MSDAMARLMHQNLMAVFNERDEVKRRMAIDSTYTADVRWTDAEGVTTGREALEAKCAALQSGLGDLQFEPDGSVHELPGFAHLAWKLVNPADGQIQMSGFDAVLVEDGLISDLWTVLIPPTGA